MILKYDIIDIEGIVIARFYTYKQAKRFVSLWSEYDLKIIKIGVK